MRVRRRYRTPVWPMKSVLCGASVLLLSFACGDTDGLRSVQETTPDNPAQRPSKPAQRPADSSPSLDTPQTTNAYVDSPLEAEQFELPGPSAPPEPPGAVRTLSNDQRRAFLQYYAPIVHKASSESSSRMGRDWITNYDFDSDQDFSNNKDNWESLQGYVTGGRFPTWSIRPTLYTAFIEFMTGNRRDAVLLYHVYHAKQEGSIHDWERIEIGLNGIASDPGSGETFRYAVVTEHSKHNSREGGDSDLNFMTTANGRHLMVWQAPERDTLLDFDKAELHYVEESWSSMRRRRNDDGTAKADINGGGEERFHYAFVPNSDPQAIANWNAQAINQANAARLSAGTTSGIRLNEVRGVTYELQDLADIFPTHWNGGRASRHWKGPNVRVLLQTGLVGGLDGGPAVPAGLQTFLSGSIDDEDSDEDRRGYPRKHWFWGAYEIGAESFYSEAFREGTPRGERGIVNGDPESLGAYFHQHDFFAHEGSRDGGGPDDERGRWLPLGWHTAEQDGFDGRWVQLFD